MFYGSPRPLLDLRSAKSTFNPCPLDSTRTTWSSNRDAQKAFKRPHDSNLLCSQTDRSFYEVSRAYGTTPTAIGQFPGACQLASMCNGP